MTNQAVTTESTLANMADLLLARIKQDKYLRLFTIFTRIMLALGFLPSGWTKVVYERFTLLAIDNPVGFFWPYV